MYYFSRFLIFLLAESTKKVYLQKNERAYRVNYIKPEILLDQKK